MRHRSDRSRRPKCSAECSGTVTPHMAPADLGPLSRAVDDDDLPPRRRRTGPYADYSPLAGQHVGHADPLSRIVTPLASGRPLASACDQVRGWRARHQATRSPDQIARLKRRIAFSPWSAVGAALEVVCRGVRPRAATGPFIRRLATVRPPQTTWPVPDRSRPPIGIQPVE